ncbi:YopX family protein [Terribacillus saccharophilus]|uniref:YopX family protein n=1 Tax=Terribacillus saccharophilus TaxID=361277 RepID=UPI002DD2177D|nr:YopX family protein [Terribacillus saccharophilus]MEC0288941.1 YopX family protein [Terribacillus saccharophilus]
MRINKFRGKKESDGKWYKGDFITDTREFNRTCDRAYILPHWDKLNCPIPVIKETIGDYTGLKDSTKWDDLSEKEQSTWLKAGNTPEKWCGKEIYEDDLIDFGGGPFQVRFQDGCFYAWTPRDSEFLHMIHDAKVVGNVHDNPNLLANEI